MIIVSEYNYLIIKMRYRYRKGVKMKGTVKWFNSNKGYGFIVTDENIEYFVHWKSIVTKNPSELKVLEQNEPVEFDLIQTDKGVQAINIIRLTTF